MTFARCLELRRVLCGQVGQGVVSGALPAMKGDALDAFGNALLFQVANPATVTTHGLLDLPRALGNREWRKLVEAFARELLQLTTEEQFDAIRHAACAGVRAALLEDPRQWSLEEAIAYSKELSKYWFEPEAEIAVSLWDGYLASRGDVTWDRYERALALHPEMRERDVFRSRRDEPGIVTLEEGAALVAVMLSDEPVTIEDLEEWLRRRMEYDRLLGWYPTAGIAKAA